MAYLLHPSTLATPSTPESASGGGGTEVSLLGPVRSLLQGIQATLHGAPPRRAGRGNARSTKSPASATCSSAAALPAAVTPSSSPVSLSPATQEKTHDGSWFRGQPQRTRVSQSSLPSCNSTHAAPAMASRTTEAAIVATSDSELYRRAVDYADVEEVLRCPLPPVAGCPTPCAFGGRGSTASPPSPSSSSSTPPLTFRCIAADADTGISIYSAAVEDCPMHLMRAYAILPCAPRDVLQYMDNDVRPMWDTYIRRSAMLRELPPPELAAAAAATHPLTTSIGASGAAVGRRSLTSLAAHAQASAATSSPPLKPRTVGAVRAASGFAYQPGQRRVAIHYLETRSPVPFVQDRDFELVVAEEVRADGTAYSKALSTPFGYHMPLDPQQSRYVRAVVLLSGMVARTLEAAVVEEVLPPMLKRHRASQLMNAKSKSSVKGTTHTPPSPPSPPPTEYCVLEYIGLVHPMGMLPAVLVNVVISAQLNAMRKMQAFIAQHPMSTLRPRVLATSPQATVPPLRELSAALRAAPSGAASPQPSSPTSAGGPAGEKESASSALPSSSTSAVAEELMKTASADTNANLASGPSTTSTARRETKRSGRKARSREASTRSTVARRGAGQRWWQWRPGQLLSRL